MATNLGSRPATPRTGVPGIDQSRPSTDSEFLKVVDQRPGGIVIRGGKPVTTLAPYANEFLGLAARPARGIEEAIYFAIHNG